MRQTSVLLALVTAGLLTPGPQPTGHAAAAAQAVKPGKPQAPVEITAAIQATQATLTLGFKSAAERVNVRVYGTDGLAVSGTETPVTSGSFKAGETLTLTVAYTPGQGQSNLAVAVSGQFGGNQRSRIASFTVGDKRAGARARAATAVDEKGRRIIVLPAIEK